MSLSVETNPLKNLIIMLEVNKSRAPLKDSPLKLSVKNLHNQIEKMLFETQIFENL